MAIQLRLTSDSSASVASLRRWLQRERSVSTHGRLSHAPSTEPGHQGILVDVLQLVVGAGLSSAQLFIALRAWRDSRTPAPGLTVTHVAPDGSTTRIEAATEAEFVAALDALDKRPS